MIFQNIELHNVAQTVPGPTDGGYIMLRVSQSAMDEMSERGRSQAMGGTGVELRFEILSSEGADITLRLISDVPAARNLPVFYGSIGAGWQEATKCVMNTPTRIHIAPPKDLDRLDAITKTGHYPFDPRVVRLILPGGSYEIFSVEGDVTPPSPGRTPKSSILSYGSSITHGSLSLLPMLSYPQRIAAGLGCDLYNKGFAGSALPEGALADHFASLNNWNIATLELGVNAMCLSYDEFERRARYFINTMARSRRRRVFVTDIFYHETDMGDHTRTDAFRAIVKRAAEESGLPNVHYTPGLALSPLGMAGLSGDLVHPSQKGHEAIGDAWASVIRENPCYMP